MRQAIIIKNLFYLRPYRPTCPIQKTIQDSSVSRHKADQTGNLTETDIEIFENGKPLK
jgi:hypothetical protein